MHDALRSLDLDALHARFAHEGPAAAVAWAHDTFGDAVAFACSLGLEDVALLDVLAQRRDTHGRAPRVFMLDTGRLHEETYQLYDRVTARFGLPIELMFPQHVAVQDLVRRKGTHSFFNSVDDRKECCAVRKLEPLARALHGTTAWITGLRKAQSPTRSDVKIVERDTADPSRIKVNPLALWSDDEVWEYVRARGVPYNKLHDRGFPSIGCAPCTRAIEPGEDIRAGRWWWEDPSLKECGLHRKR